MKPVIKLGTFCLILSLFVLIYFSFVKFTIPLKVFAASTLTNASATLSNPRLSFRGQPTVGNSGSSAVTISGSGQPDVNTNHLFPNDTVCFTNAGINGCIGSKNYSVGSIVDSTNFSLSSTLTNNVDTAGYVVATESGNITLTFTLVSVIPTGGDIFIDIPVASSGNVNDGIPDAGSSNTTNGFDFNKLEPTSVNVSSSGGTCTGGWNTPSVASASGTITITKATASCTGATITIVIPNMVNPSPFTSGHTQGSADNYKITVDTRDGSSNVLDTGSLAVAPVEGVLISATIDQSLSFTVSGVASTSGTLCGVTRTGSSIATTATTVPWGTISTPNTFFDAVQKLIVSTNSSGGYTVVVEENDQMGKNGAVCTGAGNESSSPPCIQDTACGGTACTTTQARNWNTATGYPGLGMTLENTNGGSDATWTYTDDGIGCSSQTYCARPLPDRENSVSKMTIMDSTIPASVSSVYVCYRISVAGTQPAGYYFNKVKYTATAIF